ncbi:MAG: hypothetical protein C4555_07455, partial [Dehalococcoidia bacterium]
MKLLRNCGSSLAFALALLLIAQSSAFVFAQPVDNGPARQSTVLTLDLSDIPPFGTEQARTSFAPGNQPFTNLTWPKTSLDELTDNADAIVTGTVIEKISYWNDEHTSIYTSVIISVDDGVKGATSGERFTVILEGGEADGMGLLVSDQPEFAVGEQTFVFLKRLSPEQIPQDDVLSISTGEQFEVYGGFRGKYTIEEDKIGTLGVAQFKERVNLVLEGINLTEQDLELPMESITSKYTFSGYRWPGSWPTVSYWINENTGDTTGEGAAVQAAAATWNAAAARFSFSYAGPTSTTNVQTYNGVNEVIWGTDVTSGALAVTTTWFYQGTYEIVENDMEFNDNYNWSTSGQYDIQTVALHEFGHFLNLSDLSSGSDKVMYYAYTGTKRSLHSDDIAGIRYIYGSSITAPQVSNASGASSVTQTAAKLNGNLTSTGGENPTVHIYWGASDGGTTPTSWANDVNLGTKAAGAFYTDISGLTANTPYYYRTYAANSAGGSWAESTASFTTLPIIYSLTMAVSGSGNVTPLVGTHHYAAGTAVSISATPASDWEFDTWTGNVGTVANVNSDNTTITMNGDYTITANFSQATLNIAISGSGNVTPELGSHTYPVGTSVNITAAPASGWEFDSWTGDISTIANASSANTTILMNGDYSIRANFSQADLTIAVNGSGSVTPSVGTHTYPVGASANVTAIPAINWAFVNWTGDISTVADVNSANTTITMNDDYTITANFNRIAGALTMAVSGSGNVTPELGDHTYPVGTSVNITAAPASGWEFDSWTGDTSTIANASSANTTILMNGDYSITANFSQADLTIAVSGSGSVTPSVGTHTYPVGASANVTAIPAVNWAFV